MRAMRLYRNLILMCEPVPNTPVSHRVVHGMISWIMLFLTIAFNSWRSYLAKKTKDSKQLGSLRH